MAFETFPIPDNTSKVGQLDERIALQTAMLTPIIAKLYQALDDRIGLQGVTLGKSGNKLTKAINGRIKSQANALAPVVNNMVAALDSRVASQADALSIQSAVISRLAQTGARPVTGGAGVAGLAPPPVTPGGVRGGAPVFPTVPSNAPGASAPFLPSPAPAAPAPPVITSPQSAGGLGWAAVVDCDTRTVDVYDLSRDDNPWVNGQGRYVPIRYGENREDLYYNWLGRGQGNEFLFNRQYLQQWVDTACHALDTNGQGWPIRGDFPHYTDTTVAQGYPVGDWPFDAQGNYIGL